MVAPRRSSSLSAASSQVGGFSSTREANETPPNPRLSADRDPSRSPNKSFYITTQEDLEEGQRAALSDSASGFGASTTTLDQQQQLANASSVMIDDEEGDDHMEELDDAEAKTVGEISIDEEKGEIDSQHIQKTPTSQSHREQSIKKTVTVATIKDPFRVVFEVNDPENPLNWGRGFRWALTVFGGILTLMVTFASSVPSQNIPDMMVYFGFSQEVGVLVISLFVMGYVAGPLLWGPSSEMYGRKPTFVVSLLPYLLFNMGCGLAKNTGTILVLRFLGGFFGASPLTNTGALLADLWDAKTRGVAVSLFSLAPFIGPALAPAVGGFIAQAGATWRWSFWVLTIFAGVMFVPTLFLLPETYPPVILARKAKRLRKETGDDRWWAPHEKTKVDFQALVYNSCVGPFKMMFEEPMLFALSVFMAYIYGIVYLTFQAFPYVYAGVYGWESGFVGLAFVPLLIGGAIMNILYVVYFHPRYLKAIKFYAPKPVPPEERLLQAMIAAVIIPVSMFWLAWTSYSSVSPASPLIATVLLGAGIYLVFLSLFTYLIDTYLFRAATALAANTIMRSLAGAGLPLFANQMYRAMHVHWATTLLAVVAVLGAPIPFVLYKMGPKLRAMSKNAPKIA